MDGEWTKGMLIFTFLLAVLIMDLSELSLNSSKIGAG
jgi:hypothetical protein